MDTVERYLKLGERRCADGRGPETASLVVFVLSLLSFGGLVTQRGARFFFSSRKRERHAGDTRCDAP